MKIISSCCGVPIKDYWERADMGICTQCGNTAAGKVEKNDTTNHISKERWIILGCFFIAGSIIVYFEMGVWPLILFDAIYLCILACLYFL